MQVVAERQKTVDRDFSAPADLPIPFWPLRAALQKVDQYQTTSFWFSAMKKATKKSYKTHIKLFCQFYQTDPDILARFPEEHLKILLDAYLGYLIKIAERYAGKPRPGHISINSIPQYFVGLRSFFDEHDKDINWGKYDKKFKALGKVANNLRGYYRDEVVKLYRVADIYDKPLVLLEYCTFVRVGAIGPAQFEHLLPIPELPGFYFLKVYPDDAEEFYYVLVTPEFMADLNALRDLRERWGEKITGKSFLFCDKRPNERKRRGHLPLTEDTFSRRMRDLADLAGVDLTNIQPNHGMRKAGNTAMKNAHVDKDFKEMLMGHTTGLDDTYYDIENPESRKEITVEYMKAIDTLTISEEHKLKRQLVEKDNELDIKEKENSILAGRVNKMEEFLRRNGWEG